MSIQVGERIPAAKLGLMADGRPHQVDTVEYFSGRRVALFAVPGAFTPTCSAHHLPGFVKHRQAFIDRGFAAIACLAVNDVFVMHAWGQAQDSQGVDMLADGNGDFCRALGLIKDASDYGMGWRSHRFALLADNGVVTHLMTEAPGEFRVSSAESVLAALD